MGTWFSSFLSLRKDELQGPHEDTFSWCLPDLLTLWTHKVKKYPPTKEPKWHQVRLLLDCKAPEKIHSSSQIPRQVGGQLREWRFPFRSTWLWLRAWLPVRQWGAVELSSKHLQRPPVHSRTEMASFTWWAGGVGEGKGEVKHVSENLISLRHTLNGNSRFAIAF